MPFILYHLKVGKQAKIRSFKLGSLKHWGLLNLGTTKYFSSTPGGGRLVIFYFHTWTNLWETMSSEFSLSSSTSKLGLHLMGTYEGFCKGRLKLHQKISSKNIATNGQDFWNDICFGISIIFLWGHLRIFFHYICIIDDICFCTGS